MILRILGKALFGLERTIDAGVGHVDDFATAQESKAGITVTERYYRYQAQNAQLEKQLQALEHEASTN